MKALVLSWGYIHLLDENSIYNILFFKALLCEWDWVYWSAWPQL